MAVRGAPKLYGDVRVEDNLALVDMIVQYLDDRARLLAAVNELKKERDRIRAAIKSGGDVRLSDRLSDIERDLSIKQSMLSSLSLAIVGMWSYVRRRIEGAGGHLPPRLRHIKAAIERYRDELREVQNEVSEELRREMVKAHGRKHRWDPAWLETVATSSSVEDEALERIEGTMEPELIIDLRLTGRQEEILRLFSQGYTYTQIAEMLGLAKGSVSVHLRKIRQKAAKADGVQMRFDLDWTGR